MKLQILIFSIFFLLLSEVGYSADPEPHNILGTTIEKRTIGRRRIKKKSIRHQKLADNSVGERNLRDDIILTEHIKNGEVIDEDISDDAAINPSKINLRDAILSTHIHNGEIVDEDINVGAEIEPTKIKGTAMVINSTASQSLNGGTLTISDQGNVGINTGSPNSNVKLHVEGATYISGPIGLGQQDLTVAGGNALDIDWTIASRVKLFVTGSGTATVDLDTPPDYPCNLMVIIHFADTADITWTSNSGSIKWHGGNAPTHTSTAGSYDVVSFYFDGTDYFAFSSLDFKPEV